MPKQKFDKKKAVTFQLVHRSQQDPLIADENAPQHVLLPVEGRESKKEKEKRLEEQHNFGIYYDDDCNYLEHLKDVSDNRMEWPDHVEKTINERIKIAKAQLPESVFPSAQEDEVGMLAKAAPVYGPQLHLDPDLVAAMDDDFDFSDPDNQLEDNFIELADGISSDQELNEDDQSDFGSEDMDEVGSLDGSERSFSKEETKSKFTSYSMTSSVMRRNEQLTLLDEKFEKLYDDYDENEIGALDCEEIEGFVPETSDILLQYAKEFERDQRKEQMDNNALTEKIKEQLNMESDEDEDQLTDMVIPEKEKWDCESILSTYSNLYNHPAVIADPQNKIKIAKKTGIPKNVLDANKLTTKALNMFNQENPGFADKEGKSVGKQSIISQLSTLSIRPKDESPEERRTRKRLLKEYRKERRIEKKMNTEAFKEEAKKQIKIAINNRNNIQGNKIL